MIAVLRPLTMMLGAVLRRDHKLEAGREVVWVKMLGGGSLLLAMPMLLGFRRQFPNTRLVLITTPSVKPFADLMGIFDEYRVIEVKGLRLFTSAFGAWLKTFRADCIVDLEVHSRLTTVFTTTTMARNRVAFWLEDIFWRRGLASHLVFFNRSSGSYHFYDRLADLFQFPVAGQQDCAVAMRAACAMPDQPRVERVCVGFACSELGQERMLTPAQWVQVFRTHLRPQHRTFLFMGGPGDAPRADAIINAVKAEFPALHLENLCGRSSLKQSAATLFASTEFWGIDSSLLHQARIAGLRCLSYWGPTDPGTRLRAGWQVDETTVYRKIACSPCVHTSEEPPCHGDNRCIQGLFAPELAPLGWTPVAYPPRR